MTTIDWHALINGHPLLSTYDIQPTKPPPTPMYRETRINGHPLQLADKVIDSRGEYGFVSELFPIESGEWLAAIRYRRDQPSFGTERIVGTGEVSLCDDYWKVMEDL